MVINKQKISVAKDVEERASCVLLVAFQPKWEAAWGVLTEQEIELTCTQKPHFWAYACLKGSEVIFQRRTGPPSLCSLHVNRLLFALEQSGYMETREALNLQPSFCLLKAGNTDLCCHSQLQ